MLEVFLDMELKNKFVDLLLENAVDDFYCFEGYKYASKDLLTSEKEKVSGRKDYAFFKVFLDEKQAKKMLKIIDEEMDTTRMQVLLHESKIKSPKSDKDKTEKLDKDKAERQDKSEKRDKVEKQDKSDKREKKKSK